MKSLVVRELGVQEYHVSWRAMTDFTSARTKDSPDEIWLLEHTPVFTQGQAGKAEHILDPADIPVIQTDRGGQVTYHGPGQLVVYLMIDLRRRKIGPKSLIIAMESCVIRLLSLFNIVGTTHEGAPGVYVKEAKIASLGLRVRKGCSFHGLALNVTNDLSPFRRINPCGYKGLEVTRLDHWTEKAVNPKRIGDMLINELICELNYPEFQKSTMWSERL